MRKYLRFSSDLTEVLVRPGPEPHLPGATVSLGLAVGQAGQENHTVEAHGGALATVGVWKYLSDDQNLLSLQQISDFWLAEQTPFFTHFTLETFPLI